MSAILEVEEKLDTQLSGEFSLYRLPVEDYEKMIKFGICNDDNKIELRNKN